jgi:hypothetical protein
LHLGFARVQEEVMPPASMVMIVSNKKIFFILMWIIPLREDKFSNFSINRKALSLKLFFTLNQYYAR